MPPTAPAVLRLTLIALAAMACVDAAASAPVTVEEAVADAAPVVAGAMATVEISSRKTRSSVVLPSNSRNSINTSPETYVRYLLV